VTAKKKKKKQRWKENKKNKCGVVGEVMDAPPKVCVEAAEFSIFASGGGSWWWKENRHRGSVLIGTPIDLLFAFLSFTLSSPLCLFFVYVFPCLFKNRCASPRTRGWRLQTQLCCALSGFLSDKTNTHTKSTRA
jgi:hypothetical protein